MANPYASSNMDPFQDDFRYRPPAGVAAPQPQWGQPAATGSPSGPPRVPAPGTGGGGFYDAPASAHQSPPPSAPYNPTALPQPGDRQQMYAAPPQPGREDAPPPPLPVPEARELQTAKFWTIEFYQQFWDVDTQHVLRRMSNACLPLNPPDFLLDRNWHGAGGAFQIPHNGGGGGGGVGPNDGASNGGGGGGAASSLSDEYGVSLNKNPDLCGPFFICTTLWMTLAVVSNIMSKISFERTQSIFNVTPAPARAWEYDFQTAAVGCATIYAYCFGMGLVVWAIAKWNSLPVSLVDTLCLYGYSMFIFELVAVVCMMPVPALQWLFVVVGGLWSSAYLLINFWVVWKMSLQRVWFVGVVLLVFAAHMLLTMSFKFYFLAYAL